MKKMTAIEVKHLTKTFCPSQGWFELLTSKRAALPIKALVDVSFTVQEGETIALLGANGAGKTTLIKTLCTLILPDQGTALIHGHDILKQAKQARSKINLVLCEERSFYWRLTGRQNLEFFATLYGLKKRTSRKKINDTAELFGLKNLDVRFQEYSTGNKQRLALARAFLHGAPVLFMDEPTRSLDPEAANDLRKLISTHFKNKTVFFSTHNLMEAEDISDKIAILEAGNLVGFGSVEDFRERTGNPIATMEEIYLQLTGSRQGEKVVN